jgi:hypothetical protein
VVKNRVEQIEREAAALRVDLTTVGCNLGDVVTIELSADLAAAANDVLAERRIGAVVILGANHRIVGYCASSLCTQLKSITPSTCLTM